MKKQTMKKKDDKLTSIKSMDEFQKRYFPTDVGKLCPNCGSEIDTDGRSTSIPNNPYTIIDKVKDLFSRK